MQHHYAALDGDSETPQIFFTLTIEGSSYADTHTRGCNQMKSFGADPEAHTAISGKTPDSVQEAGTYNCQYETSNEIWKLYLSLGLRCFSFLLNSYFTLECICMFRDLHFHMQYLQ